VMRGEQPDVLERELIIAAEAMRKAAVALRLAGEALRTARKVDSVLANERSEPRKTFRYPWEG